MFLILGSIFIVIISYFFTERIRKYAIQNTIMDMPNHRSSHKIPTPRGGGLIIVIFSLCGFFYLAFSSYLTVKESLAIIIPLLLVSGLAWQDDKKNISTVVRAGCYFLAASCLVFFMEINIEIIHLWLMNFILVVGIVWMINLNNFMDGIDGIAGAEALTAMLFAIIIFYQLQDFSLLLISMVIASSVLGFLIHNWPPAKIFMGDVGSCSLGLIFCVIAFLAYKKHDVSLILWLILLSVFIVDTTLTLMKRILTNQKWYAAHKQHAYQILIQIGYSHKQVTLGVMGINMLIILPLAYLAFCTPEYIYSCLFLTYTVLTSVWLYIIFYLRNKRQDYTSAH